MRHHPRKRFEFKKPSLTKQSDAKKCDIGNIIERFNATGLMPESHAPIVYGDATDTDFQNDQFAVAAAKSQFETLPAAIKDQYGSPAAFVQQQVLSLRKQIKSEETEETDTSTKGTISKDLTEQHREPEDGESRSNSPEPDSQEPKGS